VDLRDTHHVLFEIQWLVFWSGFFWSGIAWSGIVWSENSRKLLLNCWIYFLIRQFELFIWKSFSCVYINSFIS
jgi:hypothetical protein